MISCCRIVTVLTLALSCVLFTSVSSRSACDTQSAKWQSDYSVFLARLHVLVEHGDTPSVKTLEAKEDSVVITDGVGGWIDRSAAKGTIQYQVNELCHGKKVTWEVILALDPVIDDVTSTWAIVPEPSKKQRHARVLFISMGKSKRPKELNLKKGSKIRLEGVLGDARKNKRFLFNGFTGVNAVYHLRLDDDEDITAFTIGFHSVTIRPIRNSGE